MELPTDQDADPELEADQVGLEYSLDEVLLADQSAQDDVAAADVAAAELDLS